MVFTAVLPWQQVVAVVLDVFLWYMDQLLEAPGGREGEGEGEGGMREVGREEGGREGGWK